MRRAVVIGAGLGGLASALRLAARGLQVTVIDRLPGPGGRGREFVREAHGAAAGVQFRYDAGPTVLTAPVLFEELFALFGEKLADHVELLPVKPWYQMRFADGAQLNYGGSTEQIQSEIARLSPRDAQAYPAFLAHSRKLFDKGYIELGSQPFLGMGSMIKAMPAMMRLRADRSVYQLTARFFEDERVRRAFSIQPLLVGGNPFDTTSIYSLIHCLEREWGIWFPRGGMARLVQALVELGQRHGVKFEWSAQAQSLEVQTQRVSSVQLKDGRRLATDEVVSNADPGFVMTQLLPPELRQPTQVQRKTYSMGLFVWYFSTNKQFSEVPHHTILFGQTYREVLHKIFKSLELPQDLSIYLHRPSATDASYTPAGYDSFYALVPVPNLQSNIDWTQTQATFQQLLAQELERRILPGLRECIVDEFCITPQYFKDELLSPHGSGFSITPHLLQSAGFRFPNRSAQLSNLYFAGAGTHPGAGVPGVVTSAKVVERLMFGSVNAPQMQSLEAA
jgi:phytoene desaturase